jgi:hypothetical protein
MPPGKLFVRIVAVTALSLVLLGASGLFVFQLLYNPYAVPAVPPVVEEQQDTSPVIQVGPYLQLPTPTGMTVMWETGVKLPSRVEYGPTQDLGLVADGRGEGRLHEVPLTGLTPASDYFYRVRSGSLVSEIYHFRTAPPPGTGRWRMAVYGDSRSNPEVHHKVAEQIRQADVNLIVHTGDIVLSGKNHDSWRKEFFEPLGELAHSVPFVTTIGNHEEDAENYFNYVSLPGNERYFGLDFANAHIVCLDSNAWIAKGRDSQQTRWLLEDLRTKRDSTWTFVAFHHPLFSAHATRPIAALRWDWSPILLDPDNHVDGVLTGHDHFYARNYRMGAVADGPAPGVLFLTTAGGGASLYKTKARDYVAREKMTHHFTLFDFDADTATVSAIDTAGEVFDRYVLTKGPTPPDEFCAFEVEDLRQTLRTALAGARPVTLPEQEVGKVDAELRLPTKFAVPVSGQLRWESVEGWTMKAPTSDFTVRPGELFVLPIQAEVAAGPFPRTPTLTIEFTPGKFRNRTIELAPLQLGGPQSIKAAASTGPVEVDGKLTEPAWQAAEAHRLLGLAPRGGRADEVRLLLGKDALFLAVRLDDPAGKVEVKGDPGKVEESRLLLGEEHVRIVLVGGKNNLTFAVSPDQSRYTNLGKTPDGKPVSWQGRAGRDGKSWVVEMAIPRNVLADWSGVKVNVVHRRKDGKDAGEWQLCPAYTLGGDVDLLPDFRPAELPDKFARLETE